MHRSSILIIAATLFLSCQDNGVDPVLNEIRFDPHSTLVYEWTISELDSMGVPTVFERDTIVTWVGSEDDAVASLNHLLRLDARYADSVAAGQSTWYRLDADQMVEVAYRGAGRLPVVLPKREGSPFAGILTRARRSLQVLSMPALLAGLLNGTETVADTPIVRSDPRVVYRYPMTPGLTWRSFSTPWFQVREVKALTMKEVRGGSFLCADVVTRNPDFSWDVEWHDYVASKGLVLRTVRADFESRTEDGSIVGIAHTEERLELIRIESHF